MADIRNPVGGSSLIAPTRPAGGASEAVRAAQRAFFQAALSQSNASHAAAKPVSTSANRLGPVDLSNPPSRPLRPGSLLDIKV